ncbi:MAG: YIP1 family protein [Caldilineaceae bacterium]
MLEPRSYPRMIGRALMLEPDAFERMADDDAPVAEGVFLVALIGLVVGVAQTIGSVLYTWAMPPAAAVEAVLTRLARTVEGYGGMASSATLDFWRTAQFAGGFDTGWARLYPIFWQPFVLLAIWLVAGMILYVLARALGGVATLPATLGASSLVIAPHVLQVTEIAPFLSVPAVLLYVWGTLMLYRAAQTAHALPWRKAAAAATLTGLLLWVVSALLTTLTYSFAQWVLS